MAQAMMWDPIVGDYRGQATNGTVVTVDKDVMDMANKRAGKAVYESDWWVETLERVLEHWGIYAKRWVDAASGVPRINFSLDRPAEVPTKPVEQALPEPPPQPAKTPSGPLSKRLMSGPLHVKDSGSEGKK